MWVTRWTCAWTLTHFPWFHPRATSELTEIAALNGGGQKYRNFSRSGAASYRRVPVPGLWRLKPSRASEMTVGHCLAPTLSALLGE